MSPHRLAIDNIFFQYNHSGIADLWSEVFAIWAANKEISSNVVILNRTSKKISGLQNHFVLPHDFSKLDSDAKYLEYICRRLGITKLISTYYTHAANLENYFLAYDCIPERTGLDMNRPEWILKKKGVNNASKFIYISNKTRTDFEEIYRVSQPGKVIYPGVPLSNKTMDADMAALQLRLPNHKYLLCLPTPLEGYKNGKLLLEAISLRRNKEDYLIVCTRDKEESYSPTLYPGIKIIFPTLSRQQYIELIKMADALVYLSLYEGMGFPPLEALEHNCPVIANRTAIFEEIYEDCLNYISTNTPAALNEMLDKLEASKLKISLPNKISEYSYNKFANELIRYIFY